jgi:hypothetical protein
MATLEDRFGAVYVSIWEEDEIELNAFAAWGMHIIRVTRTKNKDGIGIMIIEIPL